MPQRSMTVRMVCIAVAALVAGCGQERRDIPEIDRVILITIDALRADHLGCYGYRRNTSPEIDRFAREATLFRNAYAAWPKTTPSFAALFTGLYGKTTGVLRQCYLRLPGEYTTLPEILAEAGFQCAAIVSNANLGREFELCQGFEVHEEAWKFPSPNPEKQSEMQTEKAIRWLEKLEKGKKGFLFVHYVGPHAPYNMASNNHKELFIEDDFYEEGQKIAFNTELSYAISGCPAYARLEGPADLAYYIALYDASIRFFDDCTGTILDWLRNHGLLESSLIIISADHGESLGEHNYFFEHGMFAYNTCLRVPLIAHFPGSSPKGRVIETAVSLLDVMPTILDMTGVRYRGPMQGESLVPIVYGGKGRKSPEIYAEAGYAVDYQRTIISEKWKLIYFPDPHTRSLAKNALFELYDIEEDPGETRNLADAHPKVVERLKKKLFEWMSMDVKEKTQSAEDMQPTAIDEATRENLRALGYIQ